MKSVEASVVPCAAKWNSGYEAITPHLYTQALNTLNQQVELLPDGSPDPACLKEEETDWTGFVESCKDGIREPILVDRLGNILDGYARFFAAKILGIECPSQCIPIPADLTEHTFIRSQKLRRMNLNRKEKIKLIVDEIVENLKISKPRSARILAKRLGVSNKTVSVEWKKLDRHNDRTRFPHVEFTYDERMHKHEYTPATEKDEDFVEAEKLKDEKRKEAKQSHKENVVSEFWKDQTDKKTLGDIKEIKQMMTKFDIWLSYLCAGNITNQTSAVQKAIKDMKKHFQADLKSFNAACEGNSVIVPPVKRGGMIRTDGKKAASGKRRPVRITEDENFELAAKQ